jgi:hypothetical protein
MTITLTREEAQQLLEVFELFLEEAEDVTTLENNLIKMLRTRLAQSEPPCKTGSQCVGNKCTQCMEPLQREWQGLTDEEIMEMLDYGQYGRVPEYARNFVDAIEAKLKEKNT